MDLPQYQSPKKNDFNDLRFRVVLSKKTPNPKPENLNHRPSANHIRGLGGGHRYNCKWFMMARKPSKIKRTLNSTHKPTPNPKTPDP